MDRGPAPGTITATIGENGVGAIGAAGVLRRDSSEKMTVDGLVYRESTNKAPTSTMLATMVNDGTFANGRNTPIAEVSLKLADSIHHTRYPVTVARLVRMQGRIARNAADRAAYWSNPDRAERRYNILKDNPVDAPAGAVGVWRYSNLPHMVAGAMAQRVIGKNWQALTQERSFAPRGITTAGYGLPGKADGLHRTRDLTPD